MNKYGGKQFGDKLLKLASILKSLVKTNFLRGLLAIVEKPQKY